MEKIEAEILNFKTTTSSSLSFGVPISREGEVFWDKHLFFMASSLCHFPIFIGILLFLYSSLIMLCYPMRLRNNLLHFPRLRGG